MTTYSEKVLAGLEMSDLASMMEDNPNLRGYIQGYVAEYRLRQHLEVIPGVTNIKKIPDNIGIKGDYEFQWEGRRVSIELKSARSNAIKFNLLEGGTEACFDVKRAADEIMEDGIPTRNVIRGEFDILAICSFAMDNTWDFTFIHHRYLEGADDLPNRLKKRMSINLDYAPCLHKDLTKVLTDLD